VLKYLRDPIWQFFGFVATVGVGLAAIALANPALVQRWWLPGLLGTVALIALAALRRFWRLIPRGFGWARQQIKCVYLWVLWHLVVRPAKDHLNVMTSLEQATDLWRYNFYDNFAHAQQQRHTGSDIEPHAEANCDGEIKRAIFEHPPDDHKRATVVTYSIAPPSGVSLFELTGFVGIETFRPTPSGPQPTGRSPDNHVHFEIMVDGHVQFKRRKEISQWEKFSILLVARGGNLSIRFVTNNLGQNACNWAVWGEPQLIEVLRLGERASPTGELLEERGQ